MNYFCPSGDEVSDRLGDGDRAGESSEQPFQILSHPLIISESFLHDHGHGARKPVTVTVTAHGPRKPAMAIGMGRAASNRSGSAWEIWICASTSRANSKRSLMRLKNASNKTGYAIT